MNKKEKQIRKKKNKNEVLFYRLYGKYPTPNELNQFVVWRKSNPSYHFYRYKLKKESE